MFIFRIRSRWCIGAKVAAFLLNGVLLAWFSGATAAQQTLRADHESAVEYYERRIAEDPSDADLYFLLSISTDDPARKRELLSKAISLDPEHERAHFELARALLAVDLVSQALREFTAHVQAVPYGTRGDAFSAIRFGLDLEQRGLRTEAVSIYNQTLDWMLGESAFERCYAFLSLHPEKYSDFEAFRSRLQSLAPYCSRAEHRDKAAAFLHEGQVEEAAKELDLQIDENPLYQEAYLLLFDIYLQRGDTASALRSVKRYFDVERSGLERCKIFRRLNLANMAEKTEADFVRRLQKECESRDRSEVK